MATKISAIIPTFNRIDLLPKAIESALNQSLSPDLFEVIVVDNASTDNTKEVCARYSAFPNFKYVYEEKQGLNIARLRGVNESKGKYVAFTDDDAVVSNIWLEKLLHGFESITPKPGAVGGKIFPIWEAPAPNWLPRIKWVYLTILDYGDLPLFIKYPKILYGANMAFDKEMLLQYATFRSDLDRVKKKLIGGGDSWLFKKFAENSVPVYYLPEASVHHLVPVDRASKQWLYRRHYWQGRTEMLLLGDAVSAYEIKKLRNNSYREMARLTKAALKENGVDQHFKYIADFLQHCGRLVQLRSIAKNNMMQHVESSTIQHELAVKYECPICGDHPDQFLPFGAKLNSPPRPNAQCPTCKSLERHRLIWLYFKERTDLFTKKLRMLHIAPEPQFIDRLKNYPNIEYLSADLDSPIAMVKMDLTDIKYTDESFDVIYASHVLEHIPDDVKAMKELYRVLAPGGWAILQVPIWGTKTLEDPNITLPADRERVFGQIDHVRLYGNDNIYKSRLESAGFHVRVESYAKNMGVNRIERFGLMANEDIYFCKK
jgi:glycosyltransferase involved in cell wall biosynthesis